MVIPVFRSLAPLPPREAVADAVRRAVSRVAPLWPLDAFVAVNPLLGLADRDLAEASAIVARAAGARLTLPRRHYAEALADGRIAPRDLAEALAEARGLPGRPATVAALVAAAREAEPARVPLPTVADVATEVTGHDWAAEVVEAVGAFAAGRFAERPATWASPFRDLPPFAAWRAEAVHDRAPEALGVAGFRAFAAALPEDAAAATPLLVARLGVPDAGLDAYLHRLLMTVAGWAGHARYRDWDPADPEAVGDTAAEVLAVRLAWEVALLEGPGDARVAPAWARARRRLAEPVDPAPFAVDAILHAAWEKGWQRRLAAELAGGADPAAIGETDAAAESPAPRPTLQAAFCIDVRSEGVRRALEAAGPEIETLGVPGFFGFPLAWRHGDAPARDARCPAIVPATLEVAERPDDPAARRTRSAFARAFKAFKLGAVSSFGFVEALGLTFLFQLLARAFRWRPGARDDAGATARLELDPLVPLADRVDAAAAALEAMGLTRGFAKTVLLVGHGATTVNNPHASVLDCGACGGRSGDANARIAAATLNDPEVRAALAQRGIAVPGDTVFLAAHHDTTCDTLALLDAVPEGHDAGWIAARLAEAGDAAAAARAARDLPGTSIAALRSRSRDWSQVRPEWGLAGCAGFVIAPRARTRDLDLGGRCFLQSYDWHRDPGFRILEGILAGPVQVAGWLSLQYYASAVDPAVFGAGNKVLHNPVGTAGVLEGQGGDLKVGLPWQSLSDGTRLVHEPRRLTVAVAAPAEALRAIVARRPALRTVLDHRWIHLLALDDAGRIVWRHGGPRPSVVPVP